MKQPPSHLDDVHAPPLQALLPLWNLESGRVRPDIKLQGSPERCQRRWAVEDANNSLWILELLAPGQAERRERLARLLQALRNDFPYLAAYEQSHAGVFAPRHQGRCWQLSPWLEHEPLSRPEYLRDARMGISLGRCLAKLLHAGQRLPVANTADAFSLHGYVRTLLQTMDKAAPEWIARARGVERRLEPFWELLPELPRVFCHGDCHPLNILWRGGEVCALIDWEFCGTRPRLYDLANCLGCVGIEDPRALGGAFALGLIEGLGHELHAGTDARHLPELLLALRFAWLSEWLRHGDTAMIGLELDYMELLSRGLEELRKLWRLDSRV